MTTLPIDPLRRALRSTFRATTCAWIIGQRWPINEPDRRRASSFARHLSRLTDAEQVRLGQILQSVAPTYQRHAIIWLSEAPEWPPLDGLDALLKVAPECFKKKFCT